jgi:hypothetical protein
MTGTRQFTVASPSRRARWLLQLRADSPAHLDQALRDTGAGGSLVVPR